MFETLRRLMYFGLGAAAMSADKFKQFVDELVSRGDVTAEEGKKLYEEYTSRLEDEGKSVNEKLRSQVQSMMREMGLADRGQIAMLETRVAALERKIANLPSSDLGDEEPAQSQDV